MATKTMKYLNLNLVAKKRTPYSKIEKNWRVYINDRFIGRWLGWEDAFADIKEECKFGFHKIFQ